MNSLHTRLRRIEAATPETRHNHRVVLERVGGEAEADRQQAKLEAEGYTVIHVQFVSPDDMRL